MKRSRDRDEEQIESVLVPEDNNNMGKEMKRGKALDDFFNGILYKIVFHLFPK